MCCIALGLTMWRQGVGMELTYAVCTKFLLHVVPFGISVLCVVASDWRSTNMR